MVPLKAGRPVAPGHRRGHALESRHGADHRWQDDRHRSAIHSYREAVVEGGLMSYAPDTVDIFRRSASYVDRILKGEKPAVLPAQAPIKFELVVNLKTAKALGLDVPPTLLALAYEVIE